MDPNANLEELRVIANRMLDEEAESPDGFANDATRLAELVVALDEWLSIGGLLPRAWGLAHFEREKTPVLADPMVDEVEETARELAASLDEYFRAGVLSSRQRVVNALDRAKALGLTEKAE